MVVRWVVLCMCATVFADHVPCTTEMRHTFIYGKHANTAPPEGQLQCRERNSDWCNVSLLYPHIITCAHKHHAWTCTAPFDWIRNIQIVCPPSSSCEEIDTCHVKFDIHFTPNHLGTFFVIVITIIVLTSGLFAVYIIGKNVLVKDPNLSQYYRLPPEILVRENKRL
jgi:hypothetical protein